MPIPSFDFAQSRSSRRIRSDYANLGGGSLHPQLCPERQPIVSRRLLGELLRRISISGIVQSQRGGQFGLNSALTLLVVHSASMPTKERIASLLDARLT